jgi:hypothetical protein
VGSYFKLEHGDWKQPIAAQPLPLRAAMPYNSERSTDCAISKHRVQVKKLESNIVKLGSKEPSLE